MVIICYIGNLLVIRNIHLELTNLKFSYVTCIPCTINISKTCSQYSGFQFYKYCLPH